MSKGEEIQEGKVVTMSYLLTNPEGEELDRADVSDPFSYLHGVGQIVPGLEKALIGMKAGDKKKVVVTPDEAYGQMVEDLIMTVSRSQFPEGVDLQPGMEFAADVGDGNRVPFVITDVEGDQIELDGNHPLAGLTLHFNVEIHEVREASAEEKEHGHAHGPGGHAH